MEVEQRQIRIDITMYNKCVSNRPIYGVLILVLLLLPTLYGCKGQDKPKVSFASDVAPTLSSRCAECHLPGGAGFEASGFDVSSYDTVMRGTRLGPVITAGASISSTLVRLIEGKADPSISMPHGKEPLSEAQIQSIKDWINAGAMNN